MTTWKEVEGFPAYRVSDDGRVQSRWARRGGGRTLQIYLADTWRDSVLCPNRDGYFIIVLCDGAGLRRTVGIHKLVARAFCDNPNDHILVRHLNGEKTDNRAVNLAWGTVRENALDMVKHGRSRLGKKGSAKPKGLLSPHSKLSAESLDFIRTCGLGYRLTALHVGVSARTIFNVRKGLKYASQKRAGEQ